MSPIVSAMEKPKGRQKAALLLIALGPDVSSTVLKHMKESEMELLTLEIFSMEKVTEELKDSVIEECYQMSLARNFLTQGGVEYARDLLSQAVGRQKAEEMITRLIASRKPHPFDFLRETDPTQLVSFIQNESPQTIALILGHLQPSHAAAVLSRLPADIQVEVATRVAEMDRTPPEVVSHVESVLKKRLSMVLAQDLTSVGGIEYLVKVLNNVDRGTEKTILGTLDEKRADLANEIRKMMFTFDDIIQLDDRSLRRVLREVDTKDLALALKATGEELKAQMFRNMSSRAAEMLQEEIAMSGPVRLRNVEEAQQRIVNIIRRLEEAEEIVISRGGEDVLVV